MPSVAITGATGRIGSVVLRRAREDHEVMPFSGSGAEGIASLDLREESAADCLLRRCPDLVVNCAAIATPGACRRDLISAFALNVLWPARLALACSHSRVPLVHMSSDLVYSGATPPYYESSPAVPLSLYGWTKLLADHLVLRIYPEALVARTSVVFGPSPSRNQTFSEALLAGGVPSLYLDSWRNHTPVSWLADSLLSAAERCASGLLAICGRWEQTRSAFGEALMRHLGRDPSTLSFAYRPNGVPRNLAMRPWRMERLLGRQAPDLLQSLEMEYPNV